MSCKRLLESRDARRVCLNLRSLDRSIIGCLPYNFIGNERPNGAKMLNHEERGMQVSVTQTLARLASCYHFLILLLLLLFWYCFGIIFFI